MRRFWLAILLLLPLVAAQPQDRPVLLAAHRAGSVEVFDVDTLRSSGSITVLPLADGVTSGANGILFLRQGLPPDYRGCCALYALDLNTRNMTRLLQPVSGLTVSPDGQHLVTQRGNVGIEIFDVRTLQAESSIPRSTAPGLYRLSFSRDGRLLFGASNFPSPTVDILDFKERRLVKRFALPDGYTIRGAWAGNDYYVYGYRKGSGELWRVKADASELEPPVKISLPDAAPECALHEEEIVAAGGRLFLFEQFGNKSDRRSRCGKEIPGGVFLVDPQTRKLIAHFAPELHFAQLISSVDGRELYGIDVRDSAWKSVALVRLNAETGQILATQNLSPDVWSLDLANIPERLLPHGRMEARALR
jgi:hypothetical protein